jgi:hypothetical protein
MNPWYCFGLIALAGALGGLVNALLTDNGFTFPRSEKGIWCPGAISNVLLGSAAAIASWSFYGSGSTVDLATNLPERAKISLTFSALSGAFLVGVGGARWITNEVDKRLLKQSVKEAAKKNIPPETCEEILKQYPRKIVKLIVQQPDLYKQQ